MCWYAGRVEAAETARLRGLTVTRGASDTSVDVDETVSGELLDIDKAWQGIHWLLTGTAWDVTSGAGSAILGGTNVRGDGVVVNFLAPDEVREVAAGLEVLDLDEVGRRYDPEAAAAEYIYPNIWDDQDVLESYLLPNLRKVVDLYRSAAAAGDGILTMIR